MAGTPSRLPDLRVADAADPDLALQALSDDDLQCVAGWLRAPHVARWWDDPPDVGLAHIAEHLSSPNVAPFLARFQGRPIGYVQIYHANPDDFWAMHDLPRETYGLDLFIGEAGLLGRGLGPRLIGLALRRLFAMTGVARVHIDPDPANSAAIRAYEKAGFRGTGLIATPDGVCRYMTIEREGSGRSAAF